MVEQLKKLHSWMTVNLHRKKLCTRKKQNLYRKRCKDPHSGHNKCFCHNLGARWQGNANKAGKEHGSLELLVSFRHNLPTAAMPSWKAQIGSQVIADGVSTPVVTWNITAILPAVTENLSRWTSFFPKNVNSKWKDDEMIQRLEKQVLQ